MKIDLIKQIIVIFSLTLANSVVQAAPLKTPAGSEKRDLVHRYEMKASLSKGHKELKGAISRLDRFYESSLINWA